MSVGTNPCALCDGLPKSLPELKNWIEIESEIAFEIEMRALSRVTGKEFTVPAYRVAKAESGGIKVSEGSSNDSDIHSFLFGDIGLIELDGALRGPTRFVNTVGGWICGYDYGEFGGQLRWIPVKGDPITISYGNVADIAMLNSKMYVGIFDSSELSGGGIHQLSRRGSKGEWRLREIIHWKDQFPRRFCPLRDNSLFVIRSDDAIVLDVESGTSEAVSSSYFVCGKETFGIVNVIDDKVVLGGSVFLRVIDISEGKVKFLLPGENALKVCLQWPVDAGGRGFLNEAAYVDE